MGFDIFSKDVKLLLDSKWLIEAFIGCGWGEMDTMFCDG